MLAEQEKCKRVPKKRINKNRYKEKVGFERAARFFTGKYSSSYAVFVLEYSKHIKKLPRPKKNSKVYYIIKNPLPDLEEYATLEDKAFATNELLLLCGVYKDLLGLSRRSLRRGASILPQQGPGYSVEAVEADMLFLERVAEEVATVIEDRADLEDNSVKFLPDPNLLYPTWGWALRRAVLDQCIARLSLTSDSDPRIDKALEDLRSYTMSWWKDSD